jgi:rfaE bifunctional protein kinase chain/domain
MTTAEILSGFPKLRALVVGDVCLDRWCRYDPALADPSRETGIPRIAVIATQTTPGAAGTVAANIAALGARVDVLGVVGDDGFGYELRRALEQRGIGSRLLLASGDIPTFTYTKLINCQTSREDLPRVDFIYSRPLPEQFDSELVRRLENAASGYDVIFVSDQAETEHGGVVTPAMRQALAASGDANPNTIVWVDSRMRPEHFRRAIIKPNRQEADAASLRMLGRIDYAELRRRMEARLLIVTHGADGALIVDEHGSAWAHARRQENPIDICGAGDSFSAGAALAFKITGNPLAAAHFGNLVASITIMKEGTGTASPEEVLSSVAQ